MVDADLDEEVGVAFKGLRLSNMSGFNMLEKNKWIPELSMLERVQVISVLNLLRVQFSIFPKPSQF